MSLTLEELKQWAPEIADLARSARESSTNHTNSADFYRSLAIASTWEGDGGDAAQAAMVASAGDHEGAAENLGKAATGMEHAQQQAEVVANAIKDILNDAAEQPAVQINETTNQVIPPDTSFLDEEAAAKVATKVADLQTRIADALADGAVVDAELAGAIATATGTPEHAAKTASSLEDLLLPATGGDRQTAKPDESARTPSDLDTALDQLTGQTSHHPPAPDQGDPAAPLPLDPTKVEQFKALARQAMQRDGVPADQIEARLDAMVTAARQPLPRYVAPKPESMPPPGFGEGFADRWFANEQGIKNLLGQGGPGAPGVLESWKDLVKSTNDQLTNPVGTAIDEVKHAMDSPSAAYYLGEKSADAAVTAPSLIFGGEGALAARAGVLDDLAGSGAIPHQLIDNPTSTGTFEHPMPLVGADHHLPAVDGSPLIADPGRPEFNLSSPLDHMSPDLQRMAEQHLTGSGETVLGPYRPDGGGPSYIDVARENGASYFDIGDAWNAATPTERLAANQHVLDAAIRNGDTVTLSTSFGKVGGDTFTAAEIRYLEAHGYQRIGTNRLIPGNGGN